MFQLMLYCFTCMAELVEMRKNTTPKKSFVVICDDCQKELGLVRDQLRRDPRCVECGVKVPPADTHCGSCGEQEARLAEEMGIL